MTPLIFLPAVFLSAGGVLVSHYGFDEKRIEKYHISKPLQENTLMKCILLPTA